MSTSSVTTASCCAVQIEYLETANLPGAMNAELGVHKALKSPSNRAGFLSQTKTGEGAPISGSGCQLQLKLIAPECEDSSNVSNLCNDATAAAGSPYKVTQFQFVKADDNKGFVAKFTEDEFRCACEKQSQVVPAVMDAKMKKILIDEEVALITALWGCAGDYCNGVASGTDATVKTLNIFGEDGNFAQAAGWWGAQEQLNSMGFTGKPIIIGGSAVKKYMYLSKYSGGGANSIGGQVFTDSNSPYDFYYSSEWDRTVPTLMSGSGDYCLVLAPGVSQLIEYFDNVGSYQRKTPTNLRTTIQKPIDGESYTFDYRMLYDEGCESWKNEINRMAGVFCLPSDYYCSWVVGNGRMMFKLGCGPVGCETGCVAA